MLNSTASGGQTGLCPPRDIHSPPSGDDSPGLRGDGQVILLLDLQARIQFCSDPSLLRRDESAILGKSIRSLLPELPLRPGTPGYNLAYIQFWFGSGSWQRQKLRLPGSRSLPIDIHLRHVKVERQHCLLVQLHVQYQLQYSDRSLEKLCASAETRSESIFVTDATGRIEYANPAFEQLTGFARGELRGQTPGILNSGCYDRDYFRELWSMLKRGREFHGVLINRKKNGETFHEEKLIRPFIQPGGDITHFVSIGRDISERVTTLERLAQRANHDPLTGLPNAGLFRDRLRQAIAVANRHGTGFCLMYADLDKFKTVNDRMGHAAGDRLLVAAATGLRQCVRDEDTVARIGGDEFVMIFPDMDSPAEIEHLLTKITATLRQAISEACGSVGVAASIGVAFYPRDAADEETLVQGADLAMYRAKARGGNYYAFLSGELGQGGGADREH